LPASQPGGWKVQVLEGPDAGRTYPLGPRTRAGRSSDNDVRLGDPQASRLHAVVEWLQGDYVLTDQGSRNGTFLNGVQLEGPARLRDGDLIKIGNSLLRVVAPAAPAARPPTPMDYAPAAAPMRAPLGEGIVGVISMVQRRKGLFGSESFTLVLTLERLIFAKMTSEMLKDAVVDARQQAKSQGKGFFGQWKAQLGAYSARARAYFDMPVEAILREHPDNFQIPVSQVRKVQVRHGAYDEETNTPDQLIIHAGNKYRFNLAGTGAGETKKILKQVLGDRVK